MKIEYKTSSGKWKLLKSADQTPVFPCRIGDLNNLYASAWLSLHIDDASHEEFDRYQLITPRFCSSEHEPVLLLTRNGKLIEQSLVIGESFEADLLSPHALLPRHMAIKVLAHGHDNFEEFETWWFNIYGPVDLPPLLAWSSITIV